MELNFLKKIQSKGGKTTKNFEDVRHFGTLHKIPIAESAQFVQRCSGCRAPEAVIT